MSEATLRLVARYSLLVSLVLFVLFFLGVLLTGYIGMRPLMTDLQETALLFLSVTMFVAGILAKEALANLPNE